MTMSPKYQTTIRIFKQNVLNSIAQRSRFELELKGVLYAVFCLHKWRFKRQSSANDKYDTFKWGDHKANSELDIRFIVNSIRKANTVAAALMNRQQQILWKYQSSSLIYPKAKISTNSIAAKASANQVQLSR